jgi:hypothetical protein
VNVVPARSNQHCKTRQRQRWQQKQDSNAHCQTRQRQRYDERGIQTAADDPLWHINVLN